MELGIWWKGPNWISRSYSSWPILAESSDLEEVPEGKKEIVVANVSCTPEDPIDLLGKRVSSWDRAIRIIAVFVRRAKNGQLPAEERIHGYLRSSELLYAKQKCLKWAQREFEDDIKALKKENCVSERSKLSSLAPFVDDVGLLRVGGRISKAVDVTFNLKHPIILPKGHPVSKLILHDAHIKYLHIL